MIPGLKDTQMRQRRMCAGEFSFVYVCVVFASVLFQNERVRSLKFIYYCLSWMPVSLCLSLSPGY